MASGLSRQRTLGRSSPSSFHSLFTPIFWMLSPFLLEARWGPTESLACSAWTRLVVGAFGRAARVQAEEEPDLGFARRWLLIRVRKPFEGMKDILTVMTLKT